MSISETQSAFVVSGNTHISFSQMFAVPAASANPAYLIVSALDRNEYTKANLNAPTGWFSGNGATATFAGAGGDSRAVGMVFTYNAVTGRYYSSTYGYLDQLSYVASAGLNDITNLSLFGTNSLQYAQAYAASLYSMMGNSNFSYYGSATVATQPGFAGPVPSAATPGSVAAAAQSFVGATWNLDGCWVLASTIAAEAGASLPFASTWVGTAGVANGEWGVYFNGPSGQTGNWQTMVTAGDIVVIGNNSGLGHITTVASGSGANARLIDNADFGSNLANDGDSNDLIVQPAFLASMEFNQALTSDVVIYRLDCPVVSETTTTAAIGANAILNLSTIFSAADPFQKAITQYQIYDSATSDALIINGASVSAHAAAGAWTGVSLSGVSLAGGASICTDTVKVRAYNGSYWGDWTALSVAVQAPSAPALANQTADQTWIQGSRVNLVLAGNTFSDPLGLKMTYSAQADGGALPSWLSFSATTMTFSGTVPSGMRTLALTVTATDSGGLSATETFQATVPAAAPTMAHQTMAQTWTEGTQLSFTLAANTFSDPNGEALSYTASGLPSWLTLNSATGTFSGTVGYTLGAMSIKVTATDTSGLSASETFQATLVAPVPTLTDQTAKQTWTAGQALSFPLASDTFTAVPGQTLKYAASGLPSGLAMDAASGRISGTVSVTIGTYAIKVTATQTSGLSVSETFQAIVTAAAPVVSQAANQAWTANKAVSLVLPANTFVDPQGEKLTYTLSGLPAGISFNAATLTISGATVVAPSSYKITLTATDLSGLSASETFQAVVSAARPTLANQTADQVWTANKAVSFVVPPNTFADPQGEALTYTITGLPAGLSFNATTLTISGTCPVTLGTSKLTLTAKDQSGLSLSESFQATITAAAPVVSQTADQAWTANKAVSLSVASAFTDPQAEKLTYTATRSDGTALPNGLTFNTANATFGGIAPIGLGSLSITVNAVNQSGRTTSGTFRTVVAAAAPSLVSQTASQIWSANKAVPLTLPSNTFSDPQGEKLSYTATLADGSALPTWLRLSPDSAAFTGTAPVTQQTLHITVTATDASLLSSTETFQATIQASAPILGKQTATLAWTAGRPVASTLAASTFVDPQGEQMTYRATRSDGSPLPTGLAFNATTDTFSGTAPITPQTLGLTVTATNQSGLSISESFQATISATAPTVAHATPNQTWITGQSMTFLLPANTFSDPQGATLSYKAYETAGAAQWSWLHFDPALNDFYGTAPTGTTGTIGVTVVVCDACGLWGSETFGITFGAPGSHVSPLAAPAQVELYALHQ